MEKNYKRIKCACYVGNLSMAIIANFSPLLFITFRDMYDLSYSQLGLLMLINFLTQLSVDLLFSFFSHKFNIYAAIKAIPLISLLGFVVFATTPWLFAGNEFFGFVIGTVIFAASGGFSEVLISPLIAAIPSENPDRQMSMLHSIYAWSVVGLVLLSTLFFLVFGEENWQWLVLIYCISPITTFLLFLKAKLPKLDTPEKMSGILTFMKNKMLWLCVIAIFLGGIMECTMATWCSGYIEISLGISKTLGDIFGVALFSLTLGLGRTLYAKRGKNTERVLLFGSLGALICYFTAAISPIPVIGLMACATCGLFVSMLWPGSLIVSADRIPKGGVFMYALMASGGDFGASLGSQIMGIITDSAKEKSYLINLANRLEMTPDKLGMKLGMLAGCAFCTLGIIVFFILYKTKSKKTESL